MLFHTWAFVPFMIVALAGFYTLRRTAFWIPWLLACSYFFYAQWNPLYLLLIFYSTALDYLLVMLMDHSPPVTPPAMDVIETHRTTRRDPVLRAAFTISTGLAAVLCIGAAVGPAHLRPTFIVFTALVLLMAIGARMASRKAWLMISLINNLALLLFFKYARFVGENLNLLFAWVHLPLKLPDPSAMMPHGFQYVLPVGISFFTFQSMSYTIDFYFGRVGRERNFLRFATFVCFFPQLMAGPIERARQMLPQFQKAPPFEVRNLADGLSLFLVGLFKKLAMANYLAIFVDRIYDNRPERFSAATLAMATFAFAWQIFFDFNGYTDMARGLARMMGFNLVLNFNNPYLATGLGDFWARWHISLSTWFRDYVYIPMGGNRRGSLITYRNLFLTFVLSGIWHGAAWTFAIWGVLHAVGVMLTRELERSAFYRERVPTIFKQVWVFVYVCFAWIFFRAASLPDALAIVRRIGVGTFTQPYVPALMLSLVAGAWIYQFTYESRLRPLLQTGFVRIAIATAMILYLGLCSTRGEAFIYFQF